ncbi:hypothetical protein [Methylobacterium haplocladii]|uniref:Uncharacterized protein n=2 Tax=Methylobacterium haplocladii TaxID=1176176 RepID=A0A512IS63_9HYPH|nr:hypothetical protein [Methylobacterium haplocladii]GEP00547.1 hypothetical protein MHA02_29340 [Methylobacterium haplocladii]GJD85460.1 hypothetical protein HPGCJGGD_3349 [Methylobacterium haplocladii]GLS57847.1 hypothetical protein GCM10007887_05030 [Methylobacterium haplocladii]
MIRDELPKRRYDAPLSSLPSSISSIALLGVRVDNWNREPGMPAAMGDAHPDALVMEEALREIRAEDLDISGYDISYGLGPHCNVERVTAAVRSRGDLIGWLVHHAKQGKWSFEDEGAICEPAKGRQGQVTLWLKQQVECGAGPGGEPWYVTQDSTTTPVRAGQYRPGTFCKLHWIRGADDIAEDRAGYAFEHAALVRLAEILDGKLSYLKVKPPIAPPTPWIAAPPARRVLLSLVARSPDLGKPAVKAIGPKPRVSYPLRRIDPADYPLAA